MYIIIIAPMIIIFKKIKQIMKVKNNTNKILHFYKELFKDMSLIFISFKIVGLFYFVN